MNLHDLAATITTLAAHADPTTSSVGHNQGRHGWTSIHVHPRDYLTVIAALRMPPPASRRDGSGGYSVVSHDPGLDLTVATLTRAGEELAPAPGETVTYAPAPGDGYGTTSLLDHLDGGAA